jgi:hypothetical protein
MGLADEFRSGNFSLYGQWQVSIPLRPTTTLPPTTTPTTTTKETTPWSRPANGVFTTFLDP